jgi:hypothetical protein
MLAESLRSFLAQNRSPPEQKNKGNPSNPPVGRLHHFVVQSGLVISTQRGPS